jgi:sec-independent protein translocase protein TatA
MLGDILAPWHLIIILVVALLVFGPTRLPGIAHSVGSSLREFKRSLSGEGAGAGAPGARSVEPDSEASPRRGRDS